MPLRISAPKMWVPALLCSLVLASIAQGSEFTTFDCPNGAFTTPTSINTAGQITGYCFIGGWEAFLRHPNGSMQMLSIGKSGSTFAFDINDSGVIVGYFSNAANLFHGFTFDGSTVTEFDPPGSAATRPTGINSSGVVTGYFGDGSNKFTTGFVRDTFGNFTEFSVPGFSFTEPTGINSSGEICGYGYNLNNGAVDFEAFVRDPAGNLTTFQVPGSRASGALAINGSGQVTGFWVDGRMSYHGFTRDALGNFTTFDAPDAGLGRNEGTFPRSINDSGEITGNGVNGIRVNFSFTESGPATPIDFQDPSASRTIGGTDATKINSKGRVVGFFYESDGTFHGFVRNVLPPPGNNN